MVPRHFDTLMKGCRFPEREKLRSVYTEEEISQTLAIAYHYLSIMSVCLPILYILYVFRSTLQGLGDTVSPMLSGIAEFVMRTGCVLLLPLWLGAEGIFYAEVLAWTGADLVLIPSCIWALKKDQ